MIDAGVEVAFEDQFKCGLCSVKFEDSKNCTDKQKSDLRKDIRRVLGCEKKSKQPRKVVGDNSHSFELFYCPGNYISSEFSYYWKLWEDYKSGLPVAKGNINNWPGKLVDILEYLDVKIKEKKKAKE